jgi:hypothetical protein
VGKKIKYYKGKSVAVITWLEQKPLKKTTPKKEHLKRPKKPPRQLENEANIYTAAAAHNAYPHLKNKSRKQPQGPQNKNRPAATEPHQP